MMELTNNFVTEIREIIDSARKTAYRLADFTLVHRNWLIGQRIAQEELGGAERAEYGMEIIKSLSKVLTSDYGKGFDKVNLYYYLRFYKAFSKVDKVYTPCKKSPSSTLDISNILHCGMSFQLPNLSWSHFRILLQVSDKEARNWYANEAEQEGWSVRTLQRNVSSQYYHRMLQTYDKEGVHNEMMRLTAPLQDKLEYIKSPVIAEFLGLGHCTDYHESTLETSILTHLQEFLMEMGKGYAFVARQQHIHTEKRDYYIDLVFYNIYLKCYVLVDLKTDL